MIKQSAIASLAMLLFGGWALADSNRADWHGVWVSEDLDCPTPSQLEALENGLIPQGPHWQLLDGMFCEALRGERQNGSAQTEVTGLCRSFGRLESKSWSFTRTQDGITRVTGLSDDTASMKRCPR